MRMPSRAAHCGASGLGRLASDMKLKRWASAQSAAKCGCHLCPQPAVEGTPKQRHPCCSICKDSTVAHWLHIIVLVQREDRQLALSSPEKHTAPWLGGTLS